MNELLLYHGSDHIVSQPKYGLGRPNNDYGRGFYCSQSHDLAMEWAVDEDRDGYCNSYMLSLDGLSILKLNRKGFSALNWLAILVENRRFELDSPLERAAKEYLHAHFLPKDYRSYDLIIGYRADDSYFGFASRFLQGGYSLRQLSYALKLGKLGEQVVLISRKAFEQISFLGYEEAKREDYLEKKRKRDDLARACFRASRGWDFIPGDIYIQDIMREGMQHGDPRLF